MDDGHQNTAPQKEWAPAPQHRGMAGVHHDPSHTSERSRRKLFNASKHEDTIRRLITLI